MTKLYFSGGGAYNQTLISSLKTRLLDIEITTIAETHSKPFNNNKEAILFALLGYMYLTKQPAAPHLQTGSKATGVYGEIALCAK